jgi:ADP-ribose pyrophosphatase
VAVKTPQFCVEKGGSGMSEWEIRGSQSIHKNPILELLREEIRTPAGDESPWTVVSILDGVAVAPIHEDNSVTMIRQYRHAVGDWMWEFPAGRVELDEDVEFGGRRELAEEVGLKAGVMRSHGIVFPLAGICRHRIHLFEARELTVTPMALETFECLTVERLTPADLRRLIQSDDLTDGIALSMIARLDLTKG